MVPPPMLPRGLLVGCPALAAGFLYVLMTLPASPEPPGDDSLDPNCTIIRRHRIAREDFELNFAGKKPLIVASPALSNLAFVTATEQRELLRGFGHLPIQVRNFGLKGTGLPEIWYHAMPVL